MEAEELLQVLRLDEDLAGQQNVHDRLQADLNAVRDKLASSSLASLLAKQLEHDSVESSFERTSVDLKKQRTAEQARCVLRLLIVVRSNARVYADLRQ